MFAEKYLSMRRLAIHFIFIYQNIHRRILDYCLFPQNQTYSSNIYILRIGISTSTMETLYGKFTTATQADKELPTAVKLNK